jgi:PTH1 family peptidyl-tRNA hydrolase
LRVVLGLGNDGPEYRGTRHNVGFMVADAIATRCGVDFAARGDLGRLAWMAAVDFAGQRVVLAKPRTLMNRSGQAALALCRKYGIEANDLIVVYDDADLAFGRVRVRPEGGAGGHNGVRSIIESCGTKDFARIKLGILGEGRPSRDLADYVLDAFHPEERPRVAAMVEQGADAVAAVLEDGIVAAQRAFNGGTG